MTQKQKQAWVEKNSLINSVHLYSIEIAEARNLNFHLNKIKV